MHQGETTPPDHQPVLDDKPDGDEILPPMDNGIFQELLDSIGTPSPVTARDDSVTRSPKELPTTGHVLSASPRPALDSEDTQVVCQ